MDRLTARAAARMSANFAESRHSITLYHFSSVRYRTVSAPRAAREAARRARLEAIARTRVSVRTGETTECCDAKIRTAILRPETLSLRHRGDSLLSNSSTKRLTRVAARWMANRASTRRYENPPRLSEGIARAYCVNDGLRSMPFFRLLRLCQTAFLALSDGGGEESGYAR
jgi:hypothetical protein